jgi:Mrp family chromosome partitioning ATPase
MKVLAEIPSRSSPDLRTGSLRRSDLEAFDRLLGELGGARSVLMTGTGEHPRLAAVGLAAAAAAAGTRTALLECNLADPGLADALGLANAPGLHEYVTGAAAVEAVLKPVVLAGPGSAAATEPLVCIVAGRPSVEAPRVFSSERFARTLAGLRDAYELLVIDGPRLVEWGSLSVLTPRADAALACLGAGEPRNLSLPVAGLVIQN